MEYLLTAALMIPFVTVSAMILVDTLGGTE